MEHTASTDSPLRTNVATQDRNLNTSFLTPCRRMGLARKSPASSGSWHANRSSPCAISPYKSPLKTIQDNCADTLNSEHDNIKNQVTPCRNIKTLHKPQLMKRLKTSHSHPPQNCDKRNNDNIVISNQPQSCEQAETCNTTTIKEIENRPGTETDTKTEVILPQEDITEEAIKEVRMRVKQKEEKLKDLKLAHLYKKKHDVNTLQKLIQMWCEGCQAALQELQSVLLTQGHQLNIEELLNQLNIPHELVKYRADLEDFE